MLLIGFKNIVSTTARSKDDYSSVAHQKTDIIVGGPQYTSVDLSRIYNTMLEKAKESEKALFELEDKMSDQAEAGLCDIGADEYDRLVHKYIEDMEILNYDIVIIVDGIILK